MNIPIKILLPMCDAKYDVFVSLITNLIGRVKLDEHPEDNALKVGLKGEKFAVELADLTDAWFESSSIVQRIRRNNLLGYWSIAHFPVVGKKFFGLKWEPPQREELEIVGSEEKMCAEEIDDFVSKKLKLRLIELSVSQSTLQKLRLFVVDIPADAGKRNQSSIPPGMMSYEIDDHRAGDFWQLIKLGLPKMSGPQRQSKREIESSVSPSMDPIHASLREIREEIGQLSDFVRSALTTRNYESVSSQDSLHVIVLSQKEEITQLKESARSLLASKENLSADVLALKEQNKRQSELISALQVGVESTSKLKIQAEHDLATNVTAVEAAKDTIDYHIAENRKLVDESYILKQEVDSMKQKIAKLESKNRNDLAQAESEKQDMVKENGNLKEMLVQLESGSSRMTCEVNDLRSSTVALNAENQRLRNEFNENQIAIEGAKLEIAFHIEENRKLLEERQFFIAEIDLTKQKVAKLETKNQDEVALLKSENIDLNHRNRKLMEDLEKLRVEADSTVAELKRTFDEVHLSPIANTRKSDMETQTDIIEVEAVPAEVDGGGPNSTERNVDEMSKGTQKSCIADEENGTGTDLFWDNTVSKFEEASIESNVSGAASVGTKNPAQIKKDPFNSQSEFSTDDEVVTTLRPILQKLKFGWMTFQPKKNAKFVPGFVHPPDADGIPRAQKVTASGLVGDTKNTFFEFSENIPADRVDKAGVSSLKKLNARFNFSLV
ncbi:CAP-Gly domain-containing linker protein 1-like isoform X2 [Bradysia coprophila]|uniref:CAP-Gly domain-containing linker protein 1-like isoform X2 n=1 Tax=Bradysia coprophila TaxID=38358 RepID=UPI00187DD340|nr:CAP-Gly domain-containing linker protein 1-like isoform X2 [Bradysia coprophila]